MRQLAVILCLAALVTTITPGCTTAPLPTARVQLPSLDIPPPVSFVASPDIRPTGYVQVFQQPAAPQYAAVPQYAQPAAAAPCAPQAAPAYSEGYKYAAPPVPRAAGCP